MLSDRVQETTTTTGTGTLNLLGAPSGKITFVNAPHIGSGAKAFYCIAAGAEWEVGIGTVTSGSPDTLSRDTVLASSNAGGLVSFAAGTKTVFNAIPAGMQVWPNGSNITTSGAIDNLDVGIRGAFRLTAATSLTGIAGGAKGKMHLAVNANTVPLVLVNDATSTAANRFLTGTGGNIAILPGGMFLTWYDTTSSRWRVFAPGIHDAPEVDVASATTCDIGAAASRQVRITGTTTITGLGTVQAGTIRKLRFAAALTLTHNATSLIIPGGANVVTAANDTAEAMSLGSGNWIVLRYTKADGTPLVGGGGEIARRDGVLTPHEGLICKYVSATTCDVDADAVLLFDGATAKRFASLNETLDITASGANGLDTGAEANSTWYHLWAIGKSDGTLDGLLSASATSPTMPSGYTYKGYIGAVYNDSAGNFRKFGQKGDLVATGGEGCTLVDGGSATSYTALDASAAVPPTARGILLTFGVYSNSGTATVSFYCSPAGSGTTNTYGGEVVMYIPNAPAGSPYYAGAAEMPLMTPQEVKYYVGDANSRAKLFVNGWRF